jgi:hypothetical protein
MTGGGIRAVRNAAAGAVALIAGFSSYMHMVHVALACAERREVAYALPVSVDGMLVVATVVMVDDKRHTHRVRPVARLAVSVGVAASVAANIAAAHPTIGARIVAAWPAVALLLVVEMLARPPAATAGFPPTSAARREPPPAAVAADPPQLFPPPGQRRPGAPTAARHPPPEGDQAAASSAAAAPATPAQQPGSAPAGGAQATVPSRQVPPLDNGAPRPATTATTANGQPPPATTTAAPGTPPNPATAGAAHRPEPASPAARRRPAAATRQLALRIIETEPDLTRTEVAARLGLSTRRLREVLNEDP